MYELQPGEKEAVKPPKPKSRLDALLNAIDLENMPGVEELQNLSVHDVPGGTVSFLFEKSSKSVIASEEDEVHT